MTPDQEKALRAEKARALQGRDDSERLFKEERKLTDSLRTALAAAQGALREASLTLIEGRTVLDAAASGEWKHPHLAKQTMLAMSAKVTAQLSAIDAALNASGKPGGEAPYLSVPLPAIIPSTAISRAELAAALERISPTPRLAEDDADTPEPGGEAQALVAYVEIVDPMGRVSYRRPEDHPLVAEARALIAAGKVAYTIRDTGERVPAWTSAAPAPPEGHPAPLVTCSTDTEEHHGPHHLRHPTREEKSWCLDPVPVPGHPAPEGVQYLCSVCDTVIPASEYDKHKHADEPYPRRITPAPGAGEQRKGEPGQQLLGNQWFTDAQGAACPACAGDSRARHIYPSCQPAPTPEPKP